MKKITKDVYLSWYEDMLFWRKFEDKLAAVYIQQKVRGFLHLYNGQEAVLAGSLHAMDLSKDKMITAYRNHVQPIGMGVDPKRVMAELYGKSTGTSNPHNMLKATLNAFKMSESPKSVASKRSKKINEINYDKSK